MAAKPELTAYWRANLKYIGILLTLWFLVAYVCGILAVDTLDQVRVAGFKLGFWFANQGALLVFCLLIVIYIRLMDRLDRKHGLAED